ncbi:MAG: redoxin domain-containing protein, partial [Leptospiraceae bacterium]|nr:redoxin domain-containing protein [Leptospiraceae bacterium]
MRTCKLIFYVGGHLVAFVFSIACNPERQREFPKAPEFPTTQWIFSEPLKISQLRGKIVLLDFWTYSCINCIHVLSEIQALEEKWKNELVVIGIHSGKFPNEHNLQSLKSAILKYDIRHPVANDPNFQIWELYGIQAWPSFVLIDPFGRIVARKVGEGVFQAFDKLIESLVLDSDIQKNLNHKKFELFKKTQPNYNTYLKFPTKVIVSPSGRELYVSNSGANNILVIHSTSGTILEIIGEQEGFEDGSFATARFHHPQGLCYKNESLLIADTKNHAIRKVDLKNKKVSTVFKNLPNQRIAFSPWDISSNHNEFYIAMAGNHQIWKLDFQNVFQAYIGSGSEELGDENRMNARLAQPSGIIVHENKIYFLDSETSALRMFDMQRDYVSTLIGKGLFKFGDIDGRKETALMQHPLGIAYLKNKLFIADTFNHKIKVYDLYNQNLVTLAGDGKIELKDGDFTKASFHEPSGLAIFENTLYVADTNNHAIRVLNLESKKVQTLEIFYSEKIALERLQSKNSSNISLEDEEISTSTNNIVLKWELSEKYSWRAKNSFVSVESKNPQVFKFLTTKPLPFQKEMFIPVQLS